MGWAVLLRFMVQNLYEEAILPTLRWGKQSVWLAASGSRRSFRAEARTHLSIENKKLRCPVGHGAKSRRAAPVRLV